MSEAYADAEDPISLREERGQVETARRAFVEIERFVAPGRVLDVGCWTGSFLVAARERGWTTFGIEPSRWAATRARERGIEVAETELAQAGLDRGPFRCVALCDVLEHLADPAAALRTAAGMLGDRCVLYLTVPDAGSTLARLLGRRWWSVLPMHLQHFTRASMGLLLERSGFEIRSVHTHPKVFSMRYYAERMAGYAPWLERLAVGATRAVGVADRLVAPDFRDRMAVIASRVA